MSQHDEYRYSLTIRTHDEGVLCCLRALSQYAQATGNARIPWSGTQKDVWERSRHAVTFRFSEATYRTAFLREALRLLPEGSWEAVEQNDHDPPKPV